ncbi:MAG: hypothetical protein GY930_03705 [bacterium]|nr:hypothetical protein [bacterium]
MRSKLTLCLVPLVALAFGACNDTTTTKFSANAPGTILRNPTVGSLAPVFVAPNATGRAPQLRLSQVAFGRLVDVFGQNTAGQTVPVANEVLIRAGLQSDVDNYVLSTDKVTGQQNLLIPRDVTNSAGLASFDILLKAATEGLDLVLDNGFGQTGFYSMVPRNATLALTFDDLLDPELISSQNIKVLVGTPAVVPFAGRILPDPLFGDIQDFDGDGVNEYYTTRVLIDFAVNSYESFSASPALPIEPEGLPPSIDQNHDNVNIHIPTMINGIYGQHTLLANLTGHSLEIFANGSVNTTSPTQDIIRAFRAGGSTATTGDQYNGFLKDESPPEVVASLAANLDAAPLQDLAIPEIFTVPALHFASLSCAQTPIIGDVLFQTQIQGGVWSEVIENPASGPNASGVVADVVVRVLSYPPVWDDPGNAIVGVGNWVNEGTGPVQFLSAYDPAADVGLETCFIETFPLSLGFPENPAVRISNTATWGLRFNEPMDPIHFSAYDGMRLTRVNPDVQALTASDYAVTEITHSSDLTRFSVSPHFPLNHTLTQSEAYFLSLTSSGDLAPTDLAGNLLLNPLPAIMGTLSEQDQTVVNGTHVSLFSGTDEEAPVWDPSTDPYPFAEWSGQHVYLTDQAAIHPRPVSRFTQVVERSNDFTQAMTALAGGVEEPLSRMGTFTQFLWRIYDLNMDLLDQDIANPSFADSEWNLDTGKLNIDVERIYWSPVTGGVTFDSFAGFNMRLSHASVLPDELLVGQPLMPAFPNSGVTGTFAQNRLSVINDIPKEVHLRQQGYTLDPGDKIQTVFPTVLMPFPMNMDPGVDPSYYTFRDTSLTDRAGPGGYGANLAQWHALSGVPFFEDEPCDPANPIATNFYFPSQIQSAALPLLMEFRCYPDTAATTANRLDVSESQTTAGLAPMFRAFSTGGINTDGDPVFVEPDAEVAASGGYNPSSQPAPGAPTPGTDRNVYIGGIDFVVRVSRSFSVWFPTPDTTGTAISTPSYYTPVVEPADADQPVGTSIQFAYRGADAIANAYTGGAVADPELSGFQMTSVANRLDAYGDHYDRVALCQLAEVPPGSGTFIIGPNAPYQVVNHNATAANVDGLGILGAGRWFDNAGQINGSKFFQVRATFTSNAQTGQSPILSTFALGWHN